MSENSLWGIISKCKENDNDSFGLLCEKFKPLLRKYSRLLEYEDAYEDLLYCFIICIYKIPIYEENLKNNDIAILSYIKIAMKNQYIYLSKKSLENKERYLNYDNVMAQRPDNTSSINLNSKIFLLDLKNILNTKEINLVYLKFYLQYSDKEIADLYNVSRQAINKRLKTIKSKIKNEYKELI